jgi:hypothetical protein
MGLGVKFGKIEFDLRVVFIFNIGSANIRKYRRKTAQIIFRSSLASYIAFTFSLHGIASEISVLEPFASV